MNAATFVIIIAVLVMTAVAVWRVAVTLHSGNCGSCKECSKRQCGCHRTMVRIEEGEKKA
jgi:predicted metal-binding protein